MKTNILHTLKIATAIIPMAWATSAHTATLDVDVDITIPNILILYAYTDIDLDIAAGQLGAILDANAVCAGDDCEVDLSTTQTDTLTALGTTLDLGLDNTEVTPGTDPTIRLDNSWGVRGIGSDYTESVTAIAPDNEVLNLQIEDLGSPTLALQTGYVEFDIDASDPDPDNDGVIEANYTIEVTIVP